MLKKRIRLVEELFGRNADAHIFQDRKTVIVDGNGLGYRGKVMIYEKALVSEVSMGYSNAQGWINQEAVRKPHSKDGYVICVEAE